MRMPSHILDPSERVAEILFGLIMALTMSGTISVATADRFEIRTMLIGVLGCNLACGLIDGGMYLMAIRITKPDQERPSGLARRGITMNAH